MLKNHQSLRWVLSLMSLFLWQTLFAQDIRGLYVNEFKHIIGQAQEENELLQFAQSQGFNYLILYNLYHIHHHLFDLSQKESSMPLANFIRKAKTEYGILEVGAVGETFASFDRIDQFNQNHAADPMACFDVYNIEYEFWNTELNESYYCPNYLLKEGFDCSDDGSFEFYIHQMQQLHQLAQSRGIKAETYIGSPTDEQAQQLGMACDRVLIHFYRKSDVYENGNSIYNYKSSRLAALAPTEGQLEVMPIFNSRDHFMGLWLHEHLQDQAYTTFTEGQQGYDEAEGDWKAHLNLVGYQWYRYTDLCRNLIPQTTKGVLVKNTLNIGGEVDIYNTGGEKLSTLHIDPEQTINNLLGHLENGVYFLSIRHEGETVNRKIVISDD
ncbi:MAG: T9SS type A sorting domain-containing protein [Bacteroidota bacterium]